MRPPRFVVEVQQLADGAALVILMEPEPSTRPPASFVRGSIEAALRDCLAEIQNRAANTIQVQILKAAVEQSEREINTRIAPEKGPRDAE